VLFHRIVRYTLLIVFVFCCFGLKLQGQIVTRRVGVVTGGQIQFHFNSYTTITNGLTYLKYTKLRIYFDDIINLTPTFNPNSKGWTLYCRAMNPDILSDDGSPPLALGNLKIVPSVFASATPGDEVNAGFLLTDVGDGDWLARNIVVQSYYQTSMVIELDYFFASPAGLVGVAPGYYYLDLEFKIIPNP